MMVRSRAQSPGSRKAQVSKLRQIMLLAEERPAATGLANGSGSSCSVRRPCRPGDVVVDADVLWEPIPAAKEAVLQRNTLCAATGRHSPCQPV